jgi:hypothetical protein
MVMTVFSNLQGVRRKRKQDLLPWRHQRQWRNLLDGLFLLRLRHENRDQLAAPHIAGAALLLRQAGITNALAIKALLLNTTDSLSWDAGLGGRYLKSTDQLVHLASPLFTSRTEG